MNIGLVVENVPNISDDVYLHFPGGEDRGRSDRRCWSGHRPESTFMDYEIIIGLEIHVQLQTESKMFSWSGTDFGLPPNTQTDPVSLGPARHAAGDEPQGVRTGTQDGRGAPRRDRAVHQVGPEELLLSRPAQELPDQPVRPAVLAAAGCSRSRCGRTAAAAAGADLTRIHLEEDTGKLTHGAGGYSEVDLNRAGIPLLEIVTEPEIRSAADARGCLEELRLTLRYLGVSDCEMQEGSLRCDANVNLHIDKDGKTIATPIVEIKNLNSFRSVEKALIYEADRQYQQVAQGRQDDQGRPQGDPRLERREEVTKPQREKETAADYRYFPEPDLVPVVVDEAWLERIRASIGELPAPRRQRFETEYGLSPYDANVLVEQGQDVADYYDAVAKATGEFKLASNWVQQDVLRTIKERKLTVAEFPVRPDQLADLINRVKARRAEHEPGARGPGQDDRDRRAAEAIIAPGGLPDGLRPRRDRRGRRRPRSPPIPRPSRT